MITVPEYREMLFMTDEELKKKIDSMPEEDAKELLYLTIAFSNHFNGRAEKE